MIPVQAFTDINDTLEAKLHLLIEQDGTMSHEASVQVDGDTTLLAFTFDDPELSQAETCSAYIPTTLAVKMARRILYLAGDFHFTDPRAETEAALVQAIEMGGLE